MSESELSDHPEAFPSDDEIEQALRDVVASLFESNNLDELTVKRVRTAAEEKINLPTDFFKSTPAWKDKSKETIENEVSIQEKAKEAPSSPESKPARTKKAAPAKTKAAPKKPNSAATKSTKRKSTTTQKAKPQKRRKKSVESDGSEVDSESGSDDGGTLKKRRANTKAIESDEGEDDEEQEQSPAKQTQVDTGAKAKTNRGRNIVEDYDDDDDDEVEHGDQEPPNGKESKKEASEHESAEHEAKDESKEGEVEASKKSGTDHKGNDSESELSSVIDEAPPPKRKRKAKSPSAKPAKGAKTKQPKAAKDADLDPNQAEIKRLQGWLIKCGIRKMWYRELAPYDTPKAKINHLKQMLKDAGMDGRYSAEKAKEIKERRELAADLEAVTEGNKHWGKSGEEEEDDVESGKPRRRLAKGLQELDFLDNDESE